MGLRPWELPKYTLREYGELVEGYAERERATRYRFAELACWIVSPHLKAGSRLSPKDLLGTEQSEDL